MKKTFACFLAFVLLVCLLPGQSFAEGASVMIPYSNLSPVGGTVANDTTQQMEYMTENGRGFSFAYNATEAADCDMVFTNYGHQIGLGFAFDVLVNDVKQFTFVYDETDAGTKGADGTYFIGWTGNELKVTKNQKLHLAKGFNTVTVLVSNKVVNGFNVGGIRLENLTVSGMPAAEDKTYSFTELTPIGNARLEPDTTPTQLAFMTNAGDGFSFTYENTTGKKLFANVSMLYASYADRMQVGVEVNENAAFTFTAEAFGSWDTYHDSGMLGTLVLGKGTNTIRFRNQNGGQGYNVRQVTLSGLYEASSMAERIAPAEDHITLPVGETAALPAITAYYDDGTFKEVTEYTVVNSIESVAVYENGAVRALKKGTTTLTVTFEGCRTQLVVDVIPSGVEIRLDKAAFMLDSGTTAKITANTFDAVTVEWTSDNEGVATVSQDGTVTAHKRGEAIITATATGSDGKTAQATCRATVDYEGQNPILPPSWCLLIADGEPHIFDGVVYMYGSRDEPNGYNEEGRDFCSTSYHVIYSEDLVHWTDAGESLSLDDIPADLKGDSTRLWAPDVFRDPISGTYYLAACTNKARMFLLESESPTGPFTNPRAITKDGTPIHLTDPGVFVDDDNKVYLVTPGFYVMQLDPTDYSKVIPETYTNVRPFMNTENDPFEGPSLRKRGDTYYYIYIENHGKIAENGAVPTNMGYMTSKNPLGPYEYQGVIVENYDYLNAGNIHGSIMEFEGQWYVFYHMPIADLGLTRNMCIDKITFREDGTIEQAVKTSSGAKGAFRLDEKIQASSAIVYSGGRSDMRCVSRSIKGTGNLIAGFSDYPYIYFDRQNQSVTYRYVDFSVPATMLEVSVNTTAAGGVLQVLAGENVIGTAQVPNTGGQWKTLYVPVETGTGRQTVSFVLTKTPDSGRVEVDSFSFTASSIVVKTAQRKDGVLQLEVEIPSSRAQSGVTLAAAAYHASGTLLDVQLQKIDLVQGQTTADIQIPGENAALVQIFVWDCMEGMNPIAVKGCYNLFE